MGQIQELCALLEKAYISAENSNKRNSTEDFDCHFHFFFSFHSILFYLIYYFFFAKKKIEIRKNNYNLLLCLHKK